MNEPLKPCPFCNTTPILQHGPETGFYIHCPTCQSYTHGVQWSREEALAVWNNRPDPWVRITDDPETLPPGDEYPIAIAYLLNGESHITDALAFRVGNRAAFANFDGDVEYESVYAWQPAP